MGSELRFKIDSQNDSAIGRKILMVDEAAFSIDVLGELASSKRVLVMF